MKTTKSKNQHLNINSFEKRFLQDLFNSAAKVNIVINNILKNSSKNFTPEEVCLFNRLSFLFLKVSKLPSETNPPKATKKLSLISGFEKKLLIDIFSSASIVYLSINKVIQHSSVQFTTTELDILNSLSVLFSEVSKRQDELLNQ